MTPTEEGAGEEVVGLGQDTGELRVVLLDVAHGGIDLRADVFCFGQIQEEVEARIGREAEEALCMIRGSFIDTRAAGGRTRWLSPVWRAGP